MAKRKWALLIVIIALLLIVGIMVRGTIIFYTETTLIEEATVSPYFEEDKPFFAESLVSGFMAYLDNEKDAGVRLTESDAQAILTLLGTTKVKRTFKSFEEGSYELYLVDLDNEGYTMSYDLSVYFTLKKNRETNEISVRTSYSDWTYIMDDLKVYNKLVEILEKAP